MKRGLSPMIRPISLSTEQLMSDELARSGSGVVCLLGENYQRHWVRHVRSVSV